MQTLKIIRLTSGEDIIGKIEFMKDGSLTIDSPMVFMLKDNGKTFNLMMQHWLPVNLIENNIAIISPLNIITVCEPNESFSEFYENMVEKHNSEVDSEDGEMTESAAAAILEAMDEIRKDNRVIH